MTSLGGKMATVIGARSHKPTRTGSGCQATLPARGGGGVQEGAPVL